MQSNCIIAKNITKSYKSGFCLKTKTCIIPEGANVVFVGQEGAGKTTLLRCLLGLSTPKEGTIERCGHTTMESFLSSVGAVFDDRSLPVHLTPKQIEHLFAPHYPNWDSEKYKTLTKQLGLPWKSPLEHQEQAHYCVFAVALAHSPSLFVHDRGSHTSKEEEEDNLQEQRLHNLLWKEKEQRTFTQIHTRYSVDEFPPSVTHVGFLRDGTLILYGERMKLLEQCAFVHCTYEQLEQIAPYHYLLATETLRGITLLVADRFDFFLHYPRFSFENITIPTLSHFIQEGTRV